jgi:hypothetical protein
MWKWSEQHDKAFKDLTYRVKVDGHIIGSMKLLDGSWHWEVGFPLLKMPEGCNGVCSTKDEARQAIERRFNELTAGMSKQEAYNRMMKGLMSFRPRAAVK